MFGILLSSSLVRFILELATPLSTSIIALALDLFNASRLALDTFNTRLNLLLSALTSILIRFFSSSDNLTSASAISLVNFCFCSLTSGLASLELSLSSSKFDSNIFCCKSCILASNLAFTFLLLKASKDFLATLIVFCNFLSLAFNSTSLV
ncbi:Uncharacterised protein [Staphylococcus aureus]|nr:Uncharacterised protein [Staphylococcus aureus]CDP39898.1 hypothetical protein BN966_7420 [Staphylococcus aureus]CDP39987.1 hypothetical protein BN966_8330 [Staphylococcus aureus]CDP45453.1 hypothetical protein BN968_7570 [Staphylococcus aureus]CDP46826.1 hypothetical protein BN968_21470 [Staphylococcus aureus]